MFPESRNKDVLGRAEGEVIWVGAEALGEAGSLLSMPPESRKRQGEISWPLTSFFPPSFSKCLSLAKLCWQPVGNGNQANVICRGEEKWGVDLRSEHQNADQYTICKPTIPAIEKYKAGKRECRRAGCWWTRFCTE